MPPVSEACKGGIMAEFSALGLTTPSSPVFPPSRCAPAAVPR